MKTATLLAAASLFAAAGAALPAAPAHAQDPVYTGLFSNTAVGGWDTVSYFSDGGPVQGRREFTTDWQGAEWRFSSQENLDLFLADPAAYAPQYGGYCAYAVSQGGTAKGDPEVWHLHDGKLYLNVNRQIQEVWLADLEAYIALADDNWPAVIQG
ncbi:MAG: YHS domain-containing (seleno)protein [Pseudomonadota bacterium]